MYSRQRHLSLQIREAHARDLPGAAERLGMLPVEEPVVGCWRFGGGELRGGERRVDEEGETQVLQRQQEGGEGSPGDPAPDIGSLSSPGRGREGHPGSRRNRQDFLHDHPEVVMNDVPTSNDKRPTSNESSTTNLQ